MRDGRQLEAEVEALLADASHADHPLHKALADLYAEFQARLHQIERITQISDRYQSVTREATLSLSDRYTKQLKQLQKISRISDRYQLMMRDLNHALREASITDSLTGIGNRRMLMESLKAELARSDRMQRTFTIAVVDIDRFKTVNDTYGHDAGDKVLTEIARTIETDMRDYDTCGRWGGEEFLIVMPEIPAQAAALAIERLRNSIRALRVAIGDQVVEVSASFGIAEYRSGESLSTLINRADAALFAAKRAGRNRYEVAP
jgi:diguanylate cyclase (GGDEF)-like protein